MKNLEEVEQFLLKSFYESEKFLKDMRANRKMVYRGMHPVKLAEMYQQEEGTRSFIQLLLNKINPDKYNLNRFPKS